jgi:hypothetical protein
MTTISATDIAGNIIKRVAELPDRSSPDYWPDAMLVTADELKFILLSEFSEHSMMSNPGVIADAQAAIAISDGVAKLKADLQTAFSSGIEHAAKLIDRKLADYTSEHGSFDPETGATEFSRSGEEYVSTLEELAEEIRLARTEGGQG